MEILVLHPGALGDIILALPALHLLKKDSPGVRLTLAGNSDFLDAVASGLADRIVSLSMIPLHRLYGDDPLGTEDLRFWSSFDRVLSWTGSGDASLAQRLRQVHGAVRIAGWRPAAGAGTHVSRLFAESLVPWIPRPITLAPYRLRLTAENRSRAESWLEKHGVRGDSRLLALHPGAGNSAKRWPVSRFSALAQSLLADPSRLLLLIEGPAEAGISAELKRGLPPKQFLLAENVPLSLLSSLLGRCRVHVGNDSGISHLAAALGIPTVVLFGPTDPEHWAPLGDHVRVLRREAGCAGCKDEPGARHTCMNNIEVAEVMGQIAGLI